MSIDLNWETLTSGPDGDALAESIRAFIHSKFQTIPLPRFIKSVHVHGFHFGSIPPSLELKDITDPLPDFYERQEGDDESSEGEEEEEEERPVKGKARDIRGQAGQDLRSPYLGTSTPGILGGPGLSYFQGHHFGPHTGGTHTPLAAVVAQRGGINSWMAGTSTPVSHHSRNLSQSSISVEDGRLGVLREKHSVSTLAPTGSANTSRPPTRDAAHFEEAIEEEYNGDEQPGEEGGQRRREPRVDDVQAVFRIKYAGDIRLNLTAEILLDYPMPSFVGIPLKLNITGLSFDGVGVLAHIRKRVQFCFLSPEDAAAAVPPGEQDEDLDTGESGTRFGGLLQEIKVESEIGERDGGKASLKNVGKVERFVLEQVRRIFEEEFVYPSFWTFLV
ncbi:Mitochondrial distribution and morphology protein-like protein [Emericellopsis cladophorae]|uniref:Mitochondrial distribution and morphology protein 12 n=1 Tax=Emericellopsis cladophorae TaxID=2686198 RepID=A0A9P9Y2L6_9HYPO|nr:Mitochondrial distribution and morphology protein-like protein [Emericellopsis cladophorae]KAI6782366.1 Mitochondrial distribution and morphology protein-like protein [Emericellopsis cladophorae]